MILDTNGTASWLDVPESVTKELPLTDDQLAESAMQFIQNLPKEKPFFAAVGFHKPHLPFIFPAEFIKYYPPEKINLPPNSFAPVNMPPIAWHNYKTEGVLCSFTDMRYSNCSGNINSTMADIVVLNLRRAYYSAISYIDSLVGKVVDKIGKLGLAHNTIISFL